jgi:XTP/dITP diphosphohydrolase/tetrapyrrole methylase family protein/MazG family protein
MRYNIEKGSARSESGECLKNVRKEKETMKEFDELITIMERLRGENGCPWDREQTLETLKFPLVEETYEVLEAMDEGGPALREELGDLLLQIIFQAQISAEKKDFTIRDVILDISEKLIRRHPHVFKERADITSDEVVQNWEEIKKTEENHADRKSAMDGIPKALPPVMKAEKLQKRAAHVGFDWSHAEEVIAKIEEELREVKLALQIEARKAEKPQTQEEIGDLLFATVNLARFLKLNASDALSGTNKRFERRFRYVEEHCDMEKSDLATMDRYWNEAKQRGL